MTALHLAAKYGHINVLMVLEDKVPWTDVSTKVDLLVLLQQLILVLIIVYKVIRKISCGFGKLIAMLIKLT